MPDRQEWKTIMEWGNNLSDFFLRTNGTSLYERVDNNGTLYMKIALHLADWFYA